MPLQPRRSRRCSRDLGQLAPATNRDAHRPRHPRPARRAARADRATDGERLPPGRARGLPLDQRPDLRTPARRLPAALQALTTLANWFTLIPGLIGILLAAPFISELENRTYRLAWTQSITRNRWLAGKLGLPIVASLLASATLILLFTWWRAPNVHINGHLDTGNYDTTGTVVVGYTLFALALTLALGAIWRRAAAALTVAFVGYFAVRIFVDYVLRDHLVAPLTAIYKGAQQPAFLYNARILSVKATLHGHEIFSQNGGFLGGHTQAVSPGAARTIFHVVYQPQSHFWPLQLTETGLFVGLAAILVLFAAWWTRKRTA